MTLGRFNAPFQDAGLDGQQRRTGAASPFLARPPRGVLGASRFTALRRDPGYRLILGAYLHEESYPEPLAGHIFVALQEPDGARRTFGFSPVDFRSYDPHRDLGRLTAGVNGAVHDDESAFARPGVKTRDFHVDEAQAGAAMAVVDEYRSGRHRFSLARRQCSTFALDVLRAARIDVLPSWRVVAPREVYLGL